MQLAHAFNSKTGEYIHGLSANQVGQNLQSNPRFLDDYKFEEIDSGSPLFFVPARKAEGTARVIAAHFAAASNGKTRQSHVLGNRRPSLTEKLRDGARVLLSLNMDLGVHPYSFKDGKKKHALTRHDFCRRHSGEYVSLSCTNIRDLIGWIQYLKRFYKAEHEGLSDAALKKMMQERVFANYKEAVLPYGYFILGAEHKALQHLFYTLKDKCDGAKHGATRYIGLPRLIVFKPCKTTIQNGGAHDLIKGNASFDEDKEINHLSALICPDDVKAQEAFEAFKRDIIKARQTGMYVIACPTITIGQKAGQTHKHGMLRWVISDIAGQTVPCQQVRMRRPKARPASPPPPQPRNIAS